MRIRAHAYFSGMVQGVFFRANTKSCADKLGLTGWVRNTRDGRVEALFEGEEEAVRQAIDWCTTKQPFAQVESKQVEYSDYVGEFESFFIAS